MANATTINGRTISITLDGATDWSWDSATELADAPEFAELAAGTRIWIHSIAFNPSAASDAVAVREGSLTGNKIFNVSCADANDQKIEYYDTDFQGLYIAAADVTSSSSATLEIIML
jgi:hypothetical protein